MAKVEIYTKAWCGYCARAKALLGDKGVAFDEYDISMGGPSATKCWNARRGRRQCRKSSSTVSISAAAMILLR